VGVADGVAPGVGVVGVDVFVLGDGEDLDEGLAEIGEGGGGFRFDLAEGDGGEEASEGGSEIAGGQEAAGQVIGDVFSSGFAGKGLRFLASVEGAEVRMAVAARHTALAAIGEGKSTQRGANVGAVCGHGSLQEKDLDFGFILGETSRGEAWFFTGKVYQNDEYRVNIIRRGSGCWFGMR